MNISLALALLNAPIALSSVEEKGGINYELIIRADVLGDNKFLISITINLI